MDEFEHKAAKVKLSRLSLNEEKATGTSNTVESSEESLEITVPSKLGLIIPLSCPIPLIAIVTDDEADEPKKNGVKVIDEHEENNDKTIRKPRTPLIVLTPEVDSIPADNTSANTPEIERPIIHVTDCDMEEHNSKPNGIIPDSCIIAR